MLINIINYFEDTAEVGLENVVPGMRVGPVTGTDIFDEQVLSLSSEPSTQ